MREIFDRYDCDKGRRHGYERVYERVFSPLRDESIRILEVGVLRGASMLAWADYFPNAEIVGVDTFQRVPLDAVKTNKRIKLIKGDSATVKVDGHFDIVIDDGAHDFVSQRKTFENLGGCADRYFIEDVWPLDRLSEEDFRHPWLEKMKDRGFAPFDYYWLLDALKDEDATFHDLREGYQPDSFIIEINSWLRHRTLDIR